MLLLLFTILSSFFTILSAKALKLEIPYEPNFPAEKLKKLEEYKLLPDLLSRPPHLEAQITLHDGSVADFGNVVSQQQMLKAPNISWAAKVDTEHTVVIMDLDHHIDGVKNTSNASEIHYAYWVIGNVPTSSIEKGYEIVPYEAPRIDQAGQKELHRICFLVYFQYDGSRDFYTPDTVEKRKDYRMWFNIHNLTDKYIVIGPIAMNFVRAPVQVPKLNGPIKETWT
ncbi:large ribosomal subunit protein mL38 isoform X1 [Bemisia tabaci]|uniref:large ribosomal subunit protein mL38 isoform X1 n=1 Tax=Bemisia tabaci TaxID=7038 RepID=UPI003B27C227